ncbi:glycosyltransferase family 2 protein [Conexibacter sp. SYSU D00693]|uniref:glycosyltransferase n=1 Tax=Conexibacter sp. SYSU D00693 TaxID=2812560 RepID=UPI00196B8258|nr:glycosyltransferase family A protein [Conexibacter sp. SYSU D00693]
MSVRVSVIVPARDAQATLGATLRALEAQDLGEPFEVVLVDDGSRDATRAMAQASPVVTHVLPGTASGPAAARNLAVSRATGEVLAFTDADCEPEPGWLRAGLAALDAGADVVQGKVTPPPDARPGPFDRTVGVGQLSHLYETANLFVRRAWFDRVGGFEEGWLLPGRSKELGEDVWLGWRLRRAGARIAYDPAPLVRHAVFPRGPGGYVAERARLRYFPEIVRRIPEMREVFCWHRVFLNRRTAAFDLAVAGLAAAAVTRRPWPALAAAPYARTAWRHASFRGGRRRGPLVLAVDVAADAVGLGAMALGSMRYRAPLA